LVRSTRSYVLGTNLEDAVLLGKANLSLTGNDLRNVLTGNAGHNILDGGLSADTLIGGKGNDTYIVDDEGDLVIEAFNEGVDTVKASTSFRLGDHQEHLVLTGSSHINGTGNELNNRLTGNIGDNILDGNLGADTLSGGKGNDTYIVDLLQRGIGSTATAELEDKITEAANAGIDTLVLRGQINGLEKATTLTLAANLENLDASQTGITKLNLIGNASANILTGNDAGNLLDGKAGDDLLIGGAGHDILIGGLGSDTLSGGLGADIFRFDSLKELGLGARRDIITDFNSSQGDRIDLSRIDANSLLKGHNAFTFIGNAEFSAAGQLRFADQILYGNINGDLNADFEIHLIGVSSLNQLALIV
jgi:serralysin